MAAKVFAKDDATGRVAAVSWFDEKLEAALANCYKDDADTTAKAEAVARFRNACRILPSAEDEEDLISTDGGYGVKSSSPAAGYWLKALRNISWFMH